MIPTEIRKRVIWLILSVTIAAGAFSGVVIDRLVLADSPARRVSNGSGLDYSLISEAWNIVSREYVDREAIKSKALTDGAITGMVNALGDTGHSSFLTPEMLRIESNFLEGNISGIGAQIKVKDGHTVILAPIDGSPAQRAGLLSGEIILKVNGEDISGLPVELAVNRIAGKAGTKVVLTILNPKTEKTREVSIVRARVNFQNVKWETLPGTKAAHLRIAGFSHGVSKEVRTALKDINSKGLTGIVLDLRDNPGGILDEAVNTASEFLGSGNVVLKKDASGAIEPMPVKPGGVATRIPLVVLINGGTASGSEIISGAVQDARRAELVGEKTFGTGTVLQKFGLSDGSAIFLAIAEWITPKGNVIWHKGITPDVDVALPDNVSPLFPEKEKSLSPAQLEGSRDTQLLKALSILGYQRG